VADEGLIEGDAGRLVRRRAHLRAEHVELWTDIKKKHSSHAITADLSVAEEAAGARFFRADGVIVTGSATGSAARVDDVLAAKTAGLRVAVGSGITLDNVAAFAPHADVLIVGSACKVDGRWESPVDRGRTRALVEALREASQEAEAASP
jgi:predicted TIM-barrel enzyme